MNKRIFAFIACFILFSSCGIGIVAAEPSGGNSTVDDGLTDTSSHDTVDNVPTDDVSTDNTSTDDVSTDNISADDVSTDNTSADYSSVDGTNESYPIMYTVDNISEDNASTNDSFDDNQTDDNLTDGEPTGDNSTDEDELRDGMRWGYIHRPHEPTINIYYIDQRQIYINNEQNVYINFNNQI